MASYHGLSNHELILQCQDGLHPGKLLFAELIRRYQSYVEMVLYHLAPDWSDRADLAQEVWIRVYRSIKRLQEPAKFRGWLSRIATNLFYDELRKRKRIGTLLSLDAPLNCRRLSMPLSLDVRFGGDDSEIDSEGAKFSFSKIVASDTPGPAEELLTQEFYNQLRSAIANLPEAFRTTIVLREIADLPYEEIARLTGVSLGTVKSRVFRARQYLQGQLSPYLNA